MQIQVQFLLSRSVEHEVHCRMDFLEEVALRLKEEGERWGPGQKQFRATEAQS